MVNKLFAILKKEFLLLIRDRVGLAILFIMPMILIFVMTLIQDAAFSSLNDNAVPIIFVNNDKDSLGNILHRGLEKSGMCVVNTEIDGKPATKESALAAISKGKFLVGIVIPSGATEAIRDQVTLMVNEAMAVEDVIKTEPSFKEIDILIDPVAKKSVVSSITSQLRENISLVKNQVMFSTFKSQIGDLLPEGSSANKTGDYMQSQVISYKEAYATESTGGIVPNSVQHNVPAWSIFAMFFIVIPLVGSILKEKKEGSVFRLQTMPTSYLFLVNGKIIVYVGVCLIQFMLMMSVGLFLLPLLGLPVLNLGNSYLAMFVLTTACAFAATGYSVMVGTLASTEQQGAILGSLTILLMSAIGGIWVPTYIMPENMRAVSAISPLNWALEGYYGLFLRGESTVGILDESAYLFGFFVITMTITSIINRVKNKV